MEGGSHHQLPEPRISPRTKTHHLLPPILQKSVDEEVNSVRTMMGAHVDQGWPPAWSGSGSGEWGFVQEGGEGVREVAESRGGTEDMSVSINTADRMVE